MRRTIPVAAARPVLYAVLLFVAGLAYRVTFVSQGFAATDEGWLQSLGMRVAQGQVPYRDFDYALPPLSIYKEAALIKVFGDAYGILASRWAFVVVATLASVLAFLIVRRYGSDRAAFWATLPTIFYSVILYYFSNYNYDAILLLLAAVALLVWSWPGRRAAAFLAGVAIGLAFLAKPTYGALLAVVVLGGFVGPRLRATQSVDFKGLTHWPLVVVGGLAPVAVTTLGLVLAGAGRQFVYQAFLLYREAHAGSTLGLIVQGAPSYLSRPAGGVGLLLLALLLVSPQRPWWRRLRLTAVAVGLALVLALTVIRPERAQPAVLVAGFVILWGLNLVALIAGLRGGFPSPELPLLALTIQYLSQITYNGVVVYYVGAFLSLPVALLFLHRWLRLSPSGAGEAWGGGVDLEPRSAVSGATLLVGALGLWLTLGSALVVRTNVYEEAARTRLTSSFQAAKLTGITSSPATTRRIDGVVLATNQYTRPGDAVFAFPDLAVVYFLTDRRNPTRVDWYNTGSVTPAEVDQAVSELQRRPPSLVLLQTYRESDVDRSTPLDYRGEPKWDPIYEYLVAHYRQIGTAGDITILAPRG